ncbi:MAG: hypothetical protein IKQ78_02115 [Bacilli bacterium]|nr:hypothetical protein [Bacilli bacterium]
MQNLNKDALDIDVAKEARKGFGSLLKRSAPFLGLFFLILVLVWLVDYALSYVGAGTIFITVLIVGALILPFYFASLICSYLEANDRPVAAKVYFKTAGMYFSPTFFGSFRILKAALISLLMSIVAYILFSIVYLNVSSLFDPTLMADVETVYSYVLAGDAEAANNFLQNSVPLMTYSRFAAFATDAGFIIPFLYLLSRASITVFIRDFMPTPDSRTINAAYKEALRGGSYGYDRDYFKSTWWVYLILLAFYAGGTVAGYFLLEGHPYIGILMNLVGVGFMIVPLVILLPYFVLVLDNLFKKYKTGFAKAVVDIARRVFEQYKYANQISEEEAAKYEEALKQAEESIMNGTINNPDVYDAEEPDEEKEDK